MVNYASGRQRAMGAHIASDTGSVYNNMDYIYIDTQ